MSYENFAAVFQVAAPYTPEPSMTSTTPFALSTIVIVAIAVIGVIFCFVLPVMGLWYYCCSQSRARRLQQRREQQQLEQVMTRSQNQIYVPPAYISPTQQQQQQQQQYPRGAVPIEAKAVYYAHPQGQIQGQQGQGQGGQDSFQCGKCGRPFTDAVLLVSHNDSCQGGQWGGR